MNKVILIGNLTKQPELKFTPGAGTAVASFTLAINEGWGDKKKTNYIPCVAWNKTAENIANFCDKGSKVAVFGRIEVRSYDAKDGSKRYVTEVVASEVQFLDNKKQGSVNPSGYDDMTSVDDGEIPF